MSDSESDDEFLSADEGDEENVLTKPALQEEEVDELMDIILNQKVPSKNYEKEANTITSIQVQSDSSAPPREVIAEKTDILNQKDVEKDNSKNRNDPEYINVINSDTAQDVCNDKEHSIGTLLKENAHDHMDNINIQTDTCKSLTAVSNSTCEESTSKEGEIVTVSETQNKESFNETDTLLSTGKNDKPTPQTNNAKIADEVDNTTSNMAILDNQTTCVSSEFTERKQTVHEDKDALNMDSLDLDESDDDKPLETHVLTEKKESNTNNVENMIGEAAETEVSDSGDKSKVNEITIAQSSTDNKNENKDVNSYDKKDKSDIYQSGDDQKFGANSSTNISTETISNAQDVGDDNLEKIGLSFENQEEKFHMEEQVEVLKSDNSIQSTEGESIPKQSQKKQESNSDGWGWDDWADDFIIQAAGKVSTLLETVEGQLGIPDPKEIAEKVRKEEQKNEGPQRQEDVCNSTSKPIPSNSISKPSPSNSTPKTLQEPSSGLQEDLRPNPLDKLADKTFNNTGGGGVSSWFSGFGAVSSLTGLVQNTGSELVTGGIGALEFIGKKTVDMLADGDPGLRNKRDMLSGVKKTGTLSDALREAKTMSEETMKDAQNSKKINNTVECDEKFNDLFEKFQGNAHLDALEMLSSECENKLERIFNVQSSEVREESMATMSSVRSKFELNDDFEPQQSVDNVVDFKKELFTCTKQLKIKVTCSKVLNAWTKLKAKPSKITSNEGLDLTEKPKEWYHVALSSLAELTSRFVEYQRKVADMLMLTDMEAKDLAFDRACNLKRIGELFLIELTILANDFAERLIKSSDLTSKKIVTDIYLEGSICNSMIKESHQLLLPILQCAVIK